MPFGQRWKHVNLSQVFNIRRKNMFTREIHDRNKKDGSHLPNSSTLPTAKLFPTSTPSPTPTPPEFLYLLQPLSPPEFLHLQPLSLPQLQPFPTPTPSSIFSSVKEFPFRGLAVVSVSLPVTVIKHSHQSNLRIHCSSRSRGNQSGRRLAEVISSPIRIRESRIHVC